MSYQEKEEMGLMEQHGIGSNTRNHLILKVTAPREAMVSLFKSWRDRNAFYQVLSTLCSGQRKRLGVEE